MRVISFTLFCGPFSAYFVHGRRIDEELLFIPMLPEKALQRGRVGRQNELVLFAVIRMLRIRDSQVRKRARSGFEVVTDPFGVEGRNFQDAAEFAELEQMMRGNFADVTVWHHNVEQPLSLKFKQ